MIKTFNLYFELTKPTIMLMVVFTGATSLVWEGSFLNQPIKFVLVLVGLFLTGGCANALNQYFERELDAKMKRTAGKRPLPTGRLTPLKALIFSISIGVIGILLFGFFFNWLTAMLSLGTILFYSLFYTLYLKPSTSQNIVIGGIAGAMSPVGAWAAATGSFDIVPWIMFVIIIFWTPPHFWMLAMFHKEDYRSAELPMMPLVKGDESTLKQIIIYTIILFIISMSLLLFGGGLFYLATALIVGGLFIKKVIVAYKVRTVKMYRSVFGFSILYLFVLFTGIIIDRIYNF